MPFTCREYLGAAKGSCPNPQTRETDFCETHTNEREAFMPGSTITSQEN